MVARAVQKYEGDAIPWTNPSATVPVLHKQVVDLSGRIGISAGIIPPLSAGELVVSGVWELPAGSGLTLTPSQTVYWDATS